MKPEIFAALGWYLALASLVAFPLTAVSVSRGRSLGWLIALATVWGGSLIAYWAWLGAPQMSLIMGVPVSGAAVVAWRTRAAPRAVAWRNTILISLGLFVPSFVLGLWWGLETCRGGCL